MATTTNTRSSAKPAAPKGGAQAPASKPAEAKTPVQRAGRKLRWQLLGERDANGAVAQIASMGPNAYAISGKGDAWKATHKSGSKETVLGEGVSHAKAYRLCVDHHNANYVAPAEVAKEEAKAS